MHSYHLIKMRLTSSIYIMVSYINSNPSIIYIIISYTNSYNLITDLAIYELTVEGGTEMFGIEE